MQLTATRQAPSREIVIGECIVREGKRVVVDEMRVAREGVTLFCVDSNAAGTTSRRTTVELKHDELVELEPSHEDGAAISELIYTMLSQPRLDPLGPDDIEFLMPESATVFDVTVNDRTWTVKIAP